MKTQEDLHKAALQIAASVVSSKEMVEYIFNSTTVPDPEISTEPKDDADYWRDLAVANFSYDLAETLYFVGKERANIID